MNIRFYVGLILVILSYLEFLISSYSPGFYFAGFFWFLFYFGLILICDGITVKIYKKSLLESIFRNKKNLFRFLLVSTIGGIGLDLFGQWLGKLWFYPYFTLSKYVLIYIPGWALYWLLIVESYLAIKALLDLGIKGKKFVKKYYNFEKKLYFTLGVLGIILLPLSLFLLIKGYIANGGAFNLSMPLLYEVNFVYILLGFFGVWFLFEFIEYLNKETSLLKNIIHKYFNPFLAIIFSSFILAVAMETKNFFSQYWIYLNWPLENIILFGIPFLIYVAWPLHYIAFLSLFKIIGKDLTSEIWKGDTIK
jgi:hypothetical protein